MGETEGIDAMSIIGQKILARSTSPIINSTISKRLINRMSSILGEK